MDLNWIAAVSGFALAMAGTPGPNNTMVTASGANYGFMRTLPFIAGITIGVAAIIMVVGTAGTSVVGDPHVRTVLKWGGFAYLLWLAWKIATARPAIPAERAMTASDDKPFTLVQGALFQLINPKLWVMVAGAVVTYGSAANDAGAFGIAMAFGIIFGIATLASTAAWALVGVGAGRVMRTPRRMRLFNGIMAAMLVVSLVPVMLE